MKLMIHLKVCHVSTAKSGGNSYGICGFADAQYFLLGDTYYASYIRYISWWDNKFVQENDTAGRTV